MQVERRLRKVGGSVMVPIPPEMLDELQLRTDQSVRLVSEEGSIRIEPAVPRPSPERSSSLQRRLWTSTRTCCVSSPSVEANKCSTDLVWLNAAAVGQTGGALRGRETRTRWRLR